jgi:hypothetical protein
MGISLVKKGYPLFTTVADQNREEIACGSCDAAYIFGYSDGEKSMGLEGLRKRVTAAINSSHPEHPNTLTL